MAANLSSRSDRFKQGKAMRKAVPRTAHADLTGDLTRDPVAILAQNDSARVEELLPVRYQRMTTDAFAFLRGSAAVMANDLVSQPMVGIPVQACGDCHLMNFGAFGTPEDNILFDINDFDETLPGVDFTVDVKRLAASVAVAALAAGLPRSRARALATSTVSGYHARMYDLAGLSPLVIWHSRVELADEIARMGDRGLKRKLTDIVARTRGQLENDDNFPKLVTGSTPRIDDKPPTIFHLDAKLDAKHKLKPDLLFEQYAAGLDPSVAMLLSRYDLADFVFKAVGVGSVGTFCGVGLFMSGDNDPLFLQVKQAAASVLECLSPKLSFKGDQGRRVVEGQRIMQSASDIFLGVAQDQKTGRDFYVRQLKNRRLGGVSELAEASALEDYGRLCGRTLARAHAKSGDPAMIAGYIGKGDAFADAVGSFALAYADQTAKDYAALVVAKPTKVAEPAKVLKLQKKA